MIRSLVLDGHMSYNEVLQLTPYQIAALSAKESQTPGEMSLDDYWKQKAFLDKKFGAKK